MLHWEHVKPLGAPGLKLDARREETLPMEEQRTFLEQQVGTSVAAVFKSGRSTEQIKPRIFQVDEQRARKDDAREHEQYIRFAFR